jgi:hypothetical protein
VHLGAAGHHRVVEAIRQLHVARAGAVQARATAMHQLDEALRVHFRKPPAYAPWTPPTPWHCPGRALRHLLDADWRGSIMHGG